MSHVTDQPSGPRVGLFFIGLVDAMLPNAGFASIRLLEVAGCRAVQEAQKRAADQVDAATKDIRRA